MSHEKKEYEGDQLKVKEEIEAKIQKSVIVPEYLTGKSRMRFRCYPGIGCFTKCCSGIKIYLSPYDVYSLKKRLGLTSMDFLMQYTLPSVIEKTPLPIVVMKMKEDGQRSCPFVTPEGCTIYEDRPLTCRYYPIGMGIMKKFDRNSGEDFFIKIKEDHCLGHNESKEWTIDEWKADQGADFYDEINHDWMEVVLKVKTLGPAEFSPRSLELFNMVSYNHDMFREFVFGTALLKSYEISEEYVEKIRADDLELLKFSLKWLRFLLFGEGDLKIRADVKARAEKLPEKHEK